MMMECMHSFALLGKIESPFEDLSLHKETEAQK